MNNKFFDILRHIPLFKLLTSEQFEVLEQGKLLELKSGEILATQGERSGNFWVLLEGEIRCTKKIGNRELPWITYSPGAFFGHELILLDMPYLATAYAAHPSRLFELDTDTFWQMLAACPAITRELLRVTAQRVQDLESVSQQAQKLISLGTLAAGLAHELNNPAAAVRRGTKHIKELLQRLPSLTLRLNQYQMTSKQLEFLANLPQEASQLAPTNAQLDSLTRSDREDEVIDWLETHGITDEWRLAPTLVETGVDLQWLNTLAEQVAADSLGDVLNWLEAMLTAIELLDMLEQGSVRISNLIAAVKDYSYMDQAPLKEVDVHQGLENTLSILNYKFKKGIIINRVYDRTLPHICAYGSELNQVWTNLLDNAIDAVGERGQIWVRTSRDNDSILVEIADNGSGIPQEIQHRIFDPFFTTKGVGQGTGLGLDICYRIVVGMHHGDIRVSSKPGDTRFQVRLPIRFIS